MDLSQPRQISGTFTKQSQEFIQRMVDSFFLMSPQEQVAHLKEVEESLHKFQTQKKNIEGSKSTERTSSLSSPDQSPTHFRKTTSFITDEKVAEFKTIPQMKPKSHSQRIIAQSQDKNGSLLNISNLSHVSQQYDLSALEVNEIDLYPMPPQYTQPQKQQAFHQKVIRPLKFLGIPAGTEFQNYQIAIKSRNQLKKQFPNNFKEITNLGLFYMDLVTKIGRGQRIGKQYLGKLDKLNKMLMFKIQIGMNFKRQDLAKILKIHWQSLVEIILQRIWSQESEQEHGLDFFTCKQNLLKIKKITLLGNYLTKRFCESLKQNQLPQLQVLEMKFQQQIDHEELFRIFQVISTYNDNFEIHLVTKIKDKNELPQFLTKKYGERIYLIDREKKPSDKLQKQRPVEEIKYEKPAYQKAHEENQKMGPKAVYVPRKTVASNIDPNLPLNNVPQRQGTSQIQPQQNQGLNNNLPVQQIPGVINPILQPTVNQPIFAQQQSISGIGINVSQHSNINGSIKIGTSQLNQNTEHHHHTQIVHQITQRVIEQRYQTYTQPNYNQNRYQYKGYQKGSYYDDSSDDERCWKNGYSYGGRNNQQYNKKYNGNNYYGYYKNWYD